MSDADFVGRDELLGRARDALDAARSGRGSVLSLIGEPGIGKSRSAEEIAREARARDFGVYRGAGYEGGAPPFRAWTEILRGLLRERGDDADLRAGATALAPLLPELGASHEAEDADKADDAAGSRVGLFDAVARWLVAATVRRPALLIVDDLHWLDGSSLRLIEFVAPVLPRARALLVVAARAPSSEANEALARTLQRLARSPGCVEVALEGLPLAAVERLARAQHPEPPTGEAVRTLWEQTRGNPLFVRELLLAGPAPAAGAGDARRPAALPDTIASLVAQRLARLPEPCRALLEQAAVIGVHFDLELLAAAAGASPDAVAQALEPARRAGLLEGTGSADALRFDHPLAREAVVLGAGRTRGVELHRRVAEALEARPDADADTRSALARHALAALPRVEPSRAIAHGLRAAGAARAMRAFEDAADLYERVLAADDLAGGLDPAQRADLLLDLGDARLRAGDTERGRRATLQAAEAARAHGQPESLARAALQFAGGQLVIGVRNGPVVDLLEEALAEVVAESTLGIRLRAQLAVFSLNPDDRWRAASLLDDALVDARAQGDASAEMACLAARLYVLWTPGETAARVAAADEILERARAGDLAGTAAGVPSPAAVGFARNFRLLALLEAGDMPAVERAIAELEASAERPSQLTLRPFALRFRAMLALQAGRLEAAEDLAQRAFALARAYGMAGTARMNRVAQISLIRRHEGRLGELEPALAHSAEVYPDLLSAICMLGQVYVASGRHEQARHLLDGMRVRLADLPRDANWLMTQAGVGELCAAVADPELAASVHEALLPYADGQVVVANGDATAGPVVRVLALLDARLARTDAAGRRFAEAVEACRRLRSRPFLVYTLCEQAAFRRELGEPYRVDLGEARALAEEIGMRGALEQIEALEADTPPVGSVAAPRAAEPARPRAVFRRQGESWSVGRPGRELRLRGSRGLEHLSRLLREPGREFHVLDLDGRAPEPRSSERAEPEVGPPSSLGDAGEHLDPQARVAYKQRLDALRAEGEAAGRAGAERAEEIAFLERELSRAVGLGGRVRRAASPAERARVNVTRSIGRAIDRIRAADEAFGAALAAGVRTGTFCAYEPDPDASFDWEF